MLKNMGIKPAANGNRTKKRGFTLTEIAIVLGIIGLILGAIWAAASSVYANLKANQAQQGILSAAQAVRSMFATSANTGAAGTSITTPGMFPVSWQSANAAAAAGTVGNPWHVNPAANYAYVYGNASQFSIEIDDISDTGCAQLIAFYNNQASSANGGSVPGLIGNDVVTTAAVAGTPALGANGIVNTYKAPQACVGGQLNDSISIAFDMAIM